MRIALASFIEDRSSGGMGKWSHRMAEELTRLGHTVALWWAGDFPVVRRTGRLSVLLYPPALAFRLWRSRGRFDAVVVHEPGGLWYGVLRRLATSLPPMTLVCHNVESRHFGQLLEARRRGLAVVPAGTRIKTPLLRLWQSDGAIRLADHVVCLSSLDRDYVVRRFKSARVTLQINGVAAERFRASRGEARGQRVLFVGGWLDVKGRRVLPALWSQVMEKFPLARLTVVGSGAAAEQVLAEFKERDRASVSIIPHVADEPAMAAHYAAHDLFLMPSLSEGSPLALLEAMASAMPVVAASVGGIPDILTHDTSGLLFDAAKPSEGAAHVCRLLSDADLADRLGSEARRRAQRLTWAAAAQGILAAIESTLPGRSTDPNAACQPHECFAGEGRSGQAAGE